MRKVALITGSSRGIGAAVAECFASHDYDITMTCLRSEERITAATR